MHDSTHVFTFLYARVYALVTDSLSSVLRVCFLTALALSAHICMFICLCESTYAGKWAYFWKGKATVRTVLIVLSGF